MRRNFLKRIVAFLMIGIILFSNSYDSNLIIKAEAATVPDEVNTLISCCLKAVANNATYSMSNRHGTNSYDCSSFVARMLKEAYGETSIGWSKYGYAWTTGDWTNWAEKYSVGEFVQIGSVKYEVKLRNSRDYKSAWETPGSIVIMAPTGSSVGHATIALGKIDWETASALEQGDNSLTVLSVTEYLKNKYGYDISGYSTGNNYHVPKLYTCSLDNNTYNVWKVHARSYDTGVGVDNTLSDSRIISICLEPVTKIAVTFKTNTLHSNGYIYETNTAGCVYAVYSDKAEAEKAASSGSTSGTNPVSQFTTKSDGVSITLPQKGTYYLANINPSDESLRNTDVKEIYATDYSEFTLNSYLNPGFSNFINSLRIVNQDAITKTVLPGSTYVIQEWSNSSQNYVDVFEIKDSNEDGIYDEIPSYTSRNGLINATGGIIYRTKDDAGKFRIVEKSVPTGYMNDGYTSEINILNGNQDIYVDNYAKITVQVKVIDNDGEPVRDSELNLVYNGANHTDTTDRNGIVDFSAAEGKDVVLYQNSTPAQYKVNSEYKEGVAFKVTKEDANFYQYKTITVTKLGKITVSSYNSSISSEKSGIAGNKFTVYYDEACTSVVYDNAGNAMIDLVTDSNGTVSTGYIPTGTYYVKQTGVAENFNICNEAVKVNVIGGKNAEYASATISNKRQTASLSLSTNSATPIIEGMSLSGAEYELYNSSEIVDIETNKRISANTKLGKYVTDGDGTINITKTGDGKSLPNGKYYLRQIKASQGYALNTEDVNYNASHIASEKTINLSATVEASRQSSTLNVSLLDATTKKSVLNVDNLSFVGSKYKLYTTADMYDINTAELIKAGTYLGEYTLESGSILSINSISEGQYAGHKLPLGSFKAIQVSSGCGYVVDDTAVLFSTEFNSTSATSSVTKKVYQTRQIVSITIDEKESENVEANGYVTLKGAEYRLYNEENIADINTGKVIEANTYLGKYVTDENGSLKITEMNSKDYENHPLPTGKYYLKEVSASEGYILNPEKISIDCSWNKDNETAKSIEIKSDLTNTIIYQSLTVQKVSEDIGFGSNPVPNVKYVIYSVKDILDANGLESAYYLPYKDKTYNNQGFRLIKASVADGLVKNLDAFLKDGRKAKEFITDENGGFTIENLPYGEYLLVEVDEEGYYKRGDAIYIRIPTVKKISVDDIMELGGDETELKTTYFTHNINYQPEENYEISVEAMYVKASFIIRDMNSETDEPCGETSTYVLKTIDGKEYTDGWLSAYGAVLTQGAVLTGKYILTETEAAFGYKKLAGEIEIDYKTTSVAATLNGKALKASIIETGDEDTIEIQVYHEEINNVFYQYETLTNGEINILSGAKFEVYTTKYNKETKQYERDELLRTFETNGEKQHISELANGTYILHEAKSPKKYEDSEDRIFTIDETMYNKIEIETYKYPFEPSYEITCEAEDTPEIKWRGGYGYKYNENINYICTIKNTGNTKISMNLSATFDEDGKVNFGEIEVIGISDFNKAVKETECVKVNLNPGEDVIIIYSVKVLENAEELLADSKDDKENGYPLYFNINKVTGVYSENGIERFVPKDDYEELADVIIQKNVPIQNNYLFGMDAITLLLVSEVIVIGFIVILIRFIIYRKKVRKIKKK